jgi:hypothetical protein
MSVNLIFVRKWNAGYRVLRDRTGFNFVDVANRSRFNSGSRRGESQILTNRTRNLLKEEGPCGKNVEIGWPGFVRQWPWQSWRAR